MPVALAALGGLVAVTAITVQLISTTASACSGGLPIQVAASPDIASALTAIGESWQATGPQVAGRCVTVSVRSVASATVARRLTASAGAVIDTGAVPGPTPSSDSLPDVWVPDSSAWLGRVNQVDRAAFAADPRSVAASPVVLAMPVAAATTLGWPTNRLELSTLADGLQRRALTLALAEPRQESASLIATMIVGEALATTDAELPALVKTFRGVGKAASTADLLRSLGGTVTAGPASEQAVVTYDAGRPATNLAAVPIFPEPPNLDFPFAIRTGVSLELAQAAQLFRAAVLAPSGQQVITRAAFRHPDGRAGPEFPTSVAVPTPTPFAGFSINDPERVQRALNLWSAANAASRTLALFDLTSSMGTPAAGGQTRAGVMVAAAKQGLDLFTTDSTVGMWTFAAQYRQVLPPQTLTPAHRAEFDQLLNRATPAASNVSPLYGTLLAAYKAILDGYDPTRPNIIIVLTDGGDSSPGGVRRESFSQDLQRLVDPTKPVRVVLIGIDVSPGDAADLEAIARVVGGGFFPLSTPGQIQAIFLKALLQVGAG